MVSAVYYVVGRAINNVIESSCKSDAINSTIMKIREYNSHVYLTRQADLATKKCINHAVSYVHTEK